jgi:hypothetical protein
MSVSAPPTTTTVAAAATTAATTTAAAGGREAGGGGGGGDESELSDPLAVQMEWVSRLTAAVAAAAAAAEAAPAAAAKSSFNVEPFLTSFRQIAVRDFSLSEYGGHPHPLITLTRHSTCAAAPAVAGAVGGIVERWRPYASLVDARKLCDAILQRCSVHTLRKLLPQLRMADIVATDLSLHRFLPLVVTDASADALNVTVAGYSPLLWAVHRQNDTAVQQLLWQFPATDLELCGAHLSHYLQRLSSAHSDSLRRSEVGDSRRALIVGALNVAQTTMLPQFVSGQRALLRAAFAGSSCCGGGAALSFPSELVTLIGEYLTKSWSTVQSK